MRLAAATVTISSVLLLLLSDAQGHDRALVRVVVEKANVRVNIEEFNVIVLTPDYQYRSRRPAGK